MSPHGPTQRCASWGLPRGTARGGTAAARVGRLGAARRCGLVPGRWIGGSSGRRGRRVRPARDAGFWRGGRRHQEPWARRGQNRELAFGPAQEGPNVLKGYLPGSGEAVVAVPRVVPAACEVRRPSVGPDGDPESIEPERSPAVRPSFRRDPGRIVRSIVTGDGVDIMAHRCAVRRRALCLDVPFRVATVAMVIKPSLRGEAAPASIMGSHSVGTVVCKPRCRSPLRGRRTNEVAELQRAGLGAIDRQQVTDPEGGGRFQWHMGGGRWHQAQATKKVPVPHVFRVARGQWEAESRS